MKKAPIRGFLHGAGQTYDLSVGQVFMPSRG